MYKINIFWLSLALGMHRTWQKRDFPNRPEYSLMTRSNSLLSRKKIPCSDAQGISEYRVEIAEPFDAFAGAQNTQRAKFPVFFPASREFPGHGGPGDAATRLSGLDPGF